ncbi:MAG: DUF5717 family protein [Mobilitalea sp.]
MKEKISLISKGEFEYEQPVLCLSTEQINIVEDAGKVQTGTFVISNSQERQMKGKVYSSNNLVKLKENDFHGIENQITYELNTEGVQAGTILNGSFLIISDCGEATIPFSIHIIQPYFESSLGKIKDLFQFTNLARMDWSEAKKIFRSAEFEQIILENDERNKQIYRSLINGVSTSQALEEFLIAIHKKAVVRLSVDKINLEYEINQDQITDKIILTKSNWGFTEIKVSKDADFIKLDQKFLWADRFIENSHQISFTIDAKEIKNGKQVGHIYIKTAYQTIVIVIECRRKHKSSALIKARQQKKIELNMVEQYLEFRLNKVNISEYVEKMQALIKQRSGPENSRSKELLLIHLAIIASKRKLADELLADLQSEEVMLRKTSLLDYASFLYLRALCHKEDTTTLQAANHIRRIYESGFQDWRVLWLLFQTDQSYEKNKAKKLAEIKDQFDKGCHSPILYYEAICTFREEPYLLRELNSFEIQVFNYGINNSMLNRDSVQQYVYLANKTKEYQPLVFQGLIKLYKVYESKEILSAICCLLIKGRKKEEKYFTWYQQGVEAGLRITELYEYYMYSANKTRHDPLAQQVLLYYVYNSNMTEKIKTYLYANIIINKDSFETIYRSYYKKIEIFAFNMLQAHYISRDLSILYKEFFCKNKVSSDIMMLLPYVLFRYEVVCTNPNISHVIVRHKELNGEEIIPLVDGKAQINLFTSHAQIILVDNLGQRYLETLEYSLKPYMNLIEYETSGLLPCEHPMLLLHLYDHYRINHIKNLQAIEVRRKVLTLSEISEDVIGECHQTLIEYYYENFKDELLDLYLNTIDLQLVSQNERAKYIEMMMSRGQFQKSLEAIGVFGYEDIGTARIVKFCLAYLNIQEVPKYHPIMVQLCYTVFTYQKYDETILSYLMKYYQGDYKQLLALWAAAKDFDLNTHQLEDRLLQQILFTENGLEESFPVFNSYYAEIGNHLLVRAYLTYVSYCYLVQKREIQFELLPIIKHELYYEENKICLLAWLKANSLKDNLTEQEKTFAEYNILRFIRKGMVLPFFLNYKDRMPVPEKYQNQCFITYLTDPRKQVYIHYRIAGQEEQQYKVERLPNVLSGIHCKGFLLFYPEILEYYITEEFQDTSIRTQSGELQLEGRPPEIEGSNYNQMNQMLLALEEEDEKLLLLMENYIKQDYMINKCFKPVE